MIKAAISGCCGRMGAKIAALALRDKEIKIVGAIEAADNPHIGRRLCDFLGAGESEAEITSNAETAIKASDVVIEFTAPEATLSHLDIALRNKKAIVIGTTAIGEEGVKKIYEAAGRIPVVFSPNMSVGVNVMFGLVKTAAAVLKGYKINMTEAHHKHKKDAPSGTARKLAQIIKDTIGDADIPIKAVREGEIIGDHAVDFDGEFETLRLSHHAKSREVFANGAIIAAKFAAGKKKGLFSMQDALEAGSR